MVWLLHSRMHQFCCRWVDIWLSEIWYVVIWDVDLWVTKNISLWTLVSVLSLDVWAKESMRHQNTEAFGIILQMRKHLGEQNYSSQAKKVLK